MSVEEVSRATRIPIASIERIEADHFDDLPGEVFVRGFLKAYARAVSLPVDEVLARYTASRRVAWVTPLPISSAPARKSQGRRFGVAIAFVLLLILFTLALSIVLGLVQIVLASHAASLQRGYVWTASSRDEVVPRPRMGGAPARSRRRRTVGAPPLSSSASDARCAVV